MRVQTHSELDTCETRKELVLSVGDTEDLVEALEQLEFIGNGGLLLADKMREALKLLKES